jgi:small-conductance mechanosensitive channel
VNLAKLTQKTLIVFTCIVSLIACNTAHQLSISHKTNIELAARGPENIQPEVASATLSHQRSLSEAKNQRSLSVAEMTLNHQSVAMPSPIVSAENSALILDKKASIETKIKHIEMLLVKNNQTNAKKKLNFVERLIVKKALKKIEKQQLRAANSPWDDWDGNVKIGVILIAVAVLLAILGVSGLVSGLAALAGVIFLIFGLISTY